MKAEDIKPGMSLCTTLQAWDGSLLDFGATVLEDGRLEITYAQGFLWMLGTKWDVEKICGAEAWRIWDLKFEPAEEVKP